MLPLISIIIPTSNEPTIISAIDLIRSEIKETTPYEIIIVGQNNYLNKDELRSPIVFIDSLNPLGAAAARNIGIKNSSGRLLFFIDSDCFVKPGWLSSLLHRFTQGVDVVSGGVDWNTKPFWSFVYNVSMLHEFYVSQKPATKNYLPTLNLAVRRIVIERVGLMDESLLRGQDGDWTVRMAKQGYKLFFEPNAKVLHCPKRDSFKQIWEYSKKSGYYNIITRRKYANHYHIPKLMLNPYALIIFSPLIAAYTTLKIYIQTPILLKYLYLFPLLFFTKIAWCLGAAEDFYLKVK